MAGMVYTSELNAKIAQEIVQFKRFDSLLKNFPTVQQMVAYSNDVPSYPHRKNSVLALLVQSGDMALVRRFWDTYFFKQVVPRSYERAFLKGTNSLGQAMNYHYFRNDAPFEVLREEALFRGEKCPDYNYSRTPKQIASWKIYSFLKQRHKLLSKDEPLQQSASVFERRYASEKQQLEENVLLPKHSVLLKPVQPFDRLIFYRDQEHFFEPANLDISSSVPYAEQVFQNSDFPDEFFWAGDWLRLWNDVFPDMLKENPELSLYFAKNKGALVLHQNQSLGKSNLKPGKEAAAYMQRDCKDFLLLGFNSKYCTLNEKLFRRMLRHELTHGADLFPLSAEDDEFSESDFMKFCDMMLYTKRHKLVYKVANSYSSSERRLELLAKIMELEPAEPSGDSLVQSIRKVFPLYAQWKLEDNQPKLEAFSHVVEKNLGAKRYDKWLDLVETFENYTEVDSSFDYSKAWEPFDENQRQKRKKFLREAFHFFGGGDNVFPAWENKIAYMADSLITSSSAKKEISFLDLLYKNIKDKSGLFER